MKPLDWAMVICRLSALTLLWNSAAAQTGSAPVELELVLAVDTSASVDAGEYLLQMTGISKALRDPEVVAAIEAYGDIGIALTLVHWSAEAVQVVQWAHVTDQPSAARIAGDIERTPRTALGATTAIGSAIAYSNELLSTNAFLGRRRSIDVSGDGKNNFGLPIWVQRNRVAAQGITVNGLAVIDGDPTLLAYYRDHVIVGPGAFVLTANDFGDFAHAFREKLLREIRSPVANRGDVSRSEFAAAR